MAVDINVTVSDVTLDTMIREFGNDDEGYNQFTIGDSVAAQLLQCIVNDRDSYRSFREKVLEIRDEAIREAVTPLVAQEMARPLQRTNGYGNPAGPETTLTEIIVAEAKALMTRPADTGYRGDGRTLLQKLVAEAVKAELTAIVSDAVAAVQAEFAAQAGTAVSEAVSKALKAGR